MKKPKKQTTMKEDAGKLLQDIGKLIFGSMFLGGVLRGDLPENMIIVVGFTGAVFFCIAGLILGAKKKENGEQNLEKQEK